MKSVCLRSVSIVREPTRIQLPIITLISKHLLLLLLLLLVLLALVLSVEKVAKLFAIFHELVQPTPTSAAGMNYIRITMRLMLQSRWFTLTSVVAMVVSWFR